mgnify:CR=1 FL=1
MMRSRSPISKSVNKRKEYMVNVVVHERGEMHLPITSSFGAMAGVSSQEDFCYFCRWLLRLKCV